MNINWIAAIMGLLVGLFVSLLIVNFAGFMTLILILPLISGIVSVILANDINYKDGLTTGIMSVVVIGVPLVVAAGIGLVILLLGALGGFLGVLLNKYLLKSRKSDDENPSRIKPLQNWWDNQNNGIVKTIALLVVAVVAIGLIGSIVVQANSMVRSEYSTTPTSQSKNTSTVTTPSSTVVDSSVQAAVLTGVKTFFKDYNAMYNEDGTSTGYLIDTIKIDSISKVSDTEVQVTVSCKRIASNGNQFDSTWSGKFVKKNGEWVEDGNFVQTYSYNKSTKERVI